jgi:hypothetical protein
LFKGVRSGGATYVFYLAGHMSGFAYNTGRIAGENASEYVRKKQFRINF